ncbi:MAG: glycosyltransferase [Candidatus Omnitrophica bacterium]|nr:glycosyltransferase [Candidatus Omnitrophota bacterium]
MRLAIGIYWKNGPFVFNFFDPYEEQVFAALLLRFKMAKKVICSLGGTAAEYSSSKIKRLANICADVIIGHSSYILEAFGMSHRDAHVYYLIGSEPADYSTRAASRHAKTVLTVCRVHPRKNLEFLIEVASLMPDVRFLVAGNYNLRKPYYESLIRKAAGKGVKNVSFYGEVNESVLAKLYSQSSIFFLPTKHEVFGMVFAEALSYGLPVVAPNHTSIPEAVGPGGILYTSDNLYECTKTIRLLLDCPEHWQKVSSEAKIFMKERFARDFIGQYSQLILATAKSF